MDSTHTRAARDPRARRRPSVAEATAGVVHSVSGWQHTLDVVGRVAPTLIGMVAPNAPISLCGGTLITDSLDMNSDDDRRLPPCPECAKHLSERK